MKQQPNERLIPIKSLLEKGKWDEYCKLTDRTAIFRESVKENPELYNETYLAVPEDIADKLGFIWKI